MALLNGTLQLVPCSYDNDPIRNKWVYITKLLLDGVLDKYKAKVIAKGYNQVEGIDYSETIPLVVKP